MRSSLPVVVQRVLGRVSHFSARRPGVALGLALLLTALAIPGAQRLRLDTDLARLLPEQFQSVRDLKVLEARAGAVGYVVVVLEGGDAEARRAHARHLAPRIAALPSVRYVDFERPVGWFEEHAPYFLAVDDLQTIAARLDARAAWEKRTNNPMYLDLEESAPPSIDFSDIEARYTQGDGDLGWLARQTDRFYETPTMLALFARPAQRATDVGFAESVTKAVQQVVDAEAAAAPDLTAKLTGRYQKQVDQKQRIQSDLSIASSLAAGLALLYLLVHFRRLRAIAFVLLPLLLGLFWTFGITGFAFGALNLLTGFIGALLLGLGIDHGIHLLGAWEAARRDGASVDDALTQTFARTGRAVLAAALTTIAAFVGVSLSSFRAFHEFGLVAAAGVALVVLAYCLVLPILLSRFDRAAPPAQVEPASGLMRRLLARPGRAAAAFGVLFAALCVPASAVRFDYDFAALEDSNLPSFRLDAAVNRLLGYSQTPTLIITDGAAAERAAAERLRAATRAPDSPIDMVATLSDLVPAEQAAKQPIIARIGRIVGQVKPTWLKDPELREGREILLRAAKQPPFTVADLPVEVRRQFDALDGVSGYVLAFPAIALSDGARVPELAAVLRAAADGAPVAGEAMVLADILETVRREGWPLLGGTAALVFGVLWLLLGDIRRALGAALAAALTVGGTLGVAALAGLPLNYLNLVMLPVIFGIAVDGAAHLLSRDALDPHAATHIGRAVAGAVLTTGFGFGALLVADHPGLASLGALALIGLAVNALVTLLLLPPLAARMRKART